MFADVLVDNWLPLIGGVSGLVFIIYSSIMIYYAHKKDKAIKEMHLGLSKELAEVKGLLLGRRLKP